MWGVRSLSRTPEQESGPRDASAGYGRGIPEQPCRGLPGKGERMKSFHSYLDCDRFPNPTPH